ncbi:MAG: PEP-CTERM sorting domain-containing protein [Microcystis aeruginosa]
MWGFTHFQGKSAGIFPPSTWTASNIVSVTFNFGNGAHVTTFNPNGGDGLSSSIGSFVTNALGQLTSVPSDWIDYSNVNVVSTNSTQTPNEWFVNGDNGVYFTNDLNYSVDLTNVSGNIVAANWTIQGTQTQTTPEPGTVLGLLAVGSLGLLARKRQ